MSKKNFQFNSNRQQTGSTSDNKPKTEEELVNDQAENSGTIVPETNDQDKNNEAVSSVPQVEDIKNEVVDKSKVVAEIPKEDIKEKSATVSPTKSKEGFTPVYKVELDLVSYAEAMDRTKTIIPEEGGKWQYSFFNTIKSVFSAKSQEEFNAEFNTILGFFNKNKEGIFNEKFIFRFPEQWPGSQNEFTLYRHLVYLIIQTADHKNRKKALEEINLEKVVEGLQENQKSMLFNYYLQ